MDIAPHLNKILEIIEDHKVSSIAASTGSGKSIGIASALAVIGKRVCISVPTITSAISLYKFQSKIQKAINPKAHKNFVSYAAKGDIRYDENTMVTYATSGHVRRKMLSYVSGGEFSDIDFCDVLILDESHLRSIDNDVISKLWQAAYTNNVKVPNLVIASATPTDIEIEPEPFFYKVDVKSFPIEYFYYKNYDPKQDDLLYEKAAEIALNIHNKESRNSGHILIFAPGSSEVEQISKYIIENINVTKPANVLTAYSMMPADQLDRIYEDSTNRKIIVATNIAETSITIKDVGFVVDTMYEKVSGTSQSGNINLSLQKISKDSAKQRAGRTGRTIDGQCHRICTEEMYESLLDHMVPEIERIPIHNLVIELYDVGLDPHLLFNLSSKINDSISILKSMGMIDFSEGEVQITPKGHFSTTVPLSVRSSSFLWDWINSKEKPPPFPGIVSASIVEVFGPSYFWIPRISPQQSQKEYNNFLIDYKRQFFDKFKGRSDLETFLNMWINYMDYCSSINKREPFGNHQTARNWSVENSINNKKFGELIDTIKKSIISLERSKYSVVVGRFSPINFIKKADPIFTHIYSDRILTHKRGPIYVDESGVSFKLDSKNSINLLIENPPTKLIPLGSIEIDSKGKSTRIINIGLDIESTAQENNKYASLLEELQNISEDMPINPQLDIIKLNYGNKSFFVVQDSNLLTGTKQRGFKFFESVKNAGYDSVVTFATPYGYGQVATSWACNQAGIDCHIFLPNIKPSSPLSLLAANYGAQLHEIGDPNQQITNQILRQEAQDFTTDNDYFIELGLDDDFYISHLAYAISQVSTNINPKNIWVAGGSAVVSRALNQAFPLSNLHIVQVGRKIYDDVVESIKPDPTIYVAPENFSDDAQFPPPYKSLINYDAKIWRFVMLYGQNGDFIWNIK